MNRSTFMARCAALASEARRQAASAPSGEDQKIWREIASDLEKAGARAEFLAEEDPHV